MSDTLRERLIGVLDRSWSCDVSPDHELVKALQECLSELDRLEAEVKKPRLPEGCRVSLENGAYRLFDDVGVLIATTEYNMSRLLSHFLPTQQPNVVPSTEPVQAAGDTAGATCQHCKNGHFPEQQYGQDVECVNGILIDIDIFTDGWHRDEIYPVAPCHPMWKAQCAGDEFPNDCTDRLEAATHHDDAPATPSDQGQGSQTPMNTETAEKPKPVSLVPRISRWVNEDAGASVTRMDLLNFALEVDRTLDQERT